MTQINDFALVRLVEAFPILYDKYQARGHKNAKLKDKAWKDLSEHLGASERACITRWKSIRDRFGKEYRRVVDNPTEPTNWELFPHLLFLKDHYKHGYAVHDILADIKYEPSKRKRKARHVSGECSQAEDESINEEDADTNELLLNQQMIALVKEHDVLYHKHKIRDSKNVTLKNEAWKEISETLGLSEEVCYRRWKKLRDRFSREFRCYQVNPEKPVMWEYFDDLSFLEGHYRKGVPLNVDRLKRKKGSAENTTPPASVDDNPWGNEYSADGFEDEKSIDGTVENCTELETQSIEEFLLNSPSNEEIFDELDQSKSSSENERLITDPEEKLNILIGNIQNVLHKSQDCLKTLRDQKHRQKEALDANALSIQPEMLQKVNLLLQGLSDDDRDKAERKIVQFLSECEVKSNNDEEIDDVLNVKFF